jgi:tetratricopeptide (TPR) repeat protein
VAEEEWFRSSAWGEAARDDFEMRLARARPHNRQQYIRIKGLALRSAGHTEAARELLERAADYPPPDSYLHQTVAAWETLADMAVQRGDRSTAEQLYRRILALPNQSGSSGTVEIALAELLLDTSRPSDRDEASALLNAWMDRGGMKFDHVLFRWHLVLIRLAQAIDDRETVQRAARTALNLAERGPQLPHHPDVGLVKPEEATLKRLRKLAK